MMHSVIKTMYRFVIILLISITELCIISLALPMTTTSPQPQNKPLDRRTHHSVSSDQLDYEQCYYQSNNDNIGKFIKINYGHCMSMNGPDGCCLEGYYKPGVCSNLGHICCTKPDPECSNMKNNKGIAKQAIKQQQKLFMKLNSAGNSKDDNDNDQLDMDSASYQFNSRYRPTRSNSNDRSRIRTNFEIIEMPAHMQLDAVSFVTNSLDRYKGDFDEAANYLCRMLDQKYPEPTPWACTVGKNFGYSVDPDPGKYMLFYIGNINRIRVMAFASKSAQ